MLNVVGCGIRHGPLHRLPFHWSLVTVGDIMCSRSLWEQIQWCSECQTCEWFLVQDVYKSMKYSRGTNRHTDWTAHTRTLHVSVWITMIIIVIIILSLPASPVSWASAYLDHVKSLSCVHWCLLMGKTLVVWGVSPGPEVRVCSGPTWPSPAS